MARAKKDAGNFPVIEDKAALQLVEDYCAAKDAMGKAKALMDELKPKIVRVMQGAPTAFCGVRVLTYSEIAALPATPNRKITAAMVGQVIPGKKGKAGYGRLEVQ